VRIEQLSSGREQVGFLPKDVILHQLDQLSHRAPVSGDAGQQVVDPFVVVLEPTHVVGLDPRVAQRGKHSDLLTSGVREQPPAELVDMLRVDGKASGQRPAHCRRHRHEPFVVHRQRGDRTLRTAVAVVTHEQCPRGPSRGSACSAQSARQQGPRSLAGEPA
jgi:hypothetical protein